MNIKEIENQLNILSGLQTNYLRQRETANYWIEQLSKQILELSKLRNTEKEKQKNVSVIDQMKEKISVDTAFKDQKINLLLNELFKTLEGK